MFVKPAREGLIVRHPDTGKAVPEAGENVPDTSYWRRRLADGELVPVSEKKSSAKSTAKEES